MHNEMKINKTSYLTTGHAFYTMTSPGGYNPYDFTFWYASVFTVNIVGGFDDEATNYNYGLRPVINIRSDVTITGSGTMSDPYIIN